MHERKNEALRIFMEFGPELKIPRPERIAAAFPEVPQDERGRWLREFREVDREIWKIVEEGAIGGVAREGVSRVGARPMGAGTTVSS